MNILPESYPAAIRSIEALDLRTVSLRRPSQNDPSDNSYEQEVPRKHFSPHDIGKSDEGGSKEPEDRKLSRAKGIDV